MKNTTNPAEAFATESIPKLVIKNCIPSLLAMMMMLVYNLADTFFIGMTHDDLQVAAVSLASPMFMIFVAVGTLFAIGSSSLISIALGAKKSEYAKKISAFCFWGCIAVAAVMTAAILIFAKDIVIMLGASENTIENTKNYLMITASGGICTMLSVSFTNMIRAEGKPLISSIGMIAGNILNIILDPILILGCGWGVTGAAIATVIGNLAGTLFYLVYFCLGKSSLSIRICDFSLKKEIVTGVFSIGISSSITNFLVSISSMLVNSMLSQYPDGDMYVAGYGVTMKIVMIVSLIAVGIGTGAQPLFGYCYGAKNKERMVACIRFATFFGLAFCFTSALLCFIFAKPIVGIFLTGDVACASGMHYIRIIMSTAWLMGGFLVFQSSLQAMGAALPALLTSTLRQGIVFIPLLFAMRSVLGAEGLLWAQPIADLISFAIVLFILIRKIRHLNFDAIPKS